MTGLYQSTGKQLGTLTGQMKAHWTYGVYCFIFCYQFTVYDDSLCHIPALLFILHPQIIPHVNKGNLFCLFSPLPLHKLFHAISLHFTFGLYYIQFILCSSECIHSVSISNHICYTMYLFIILLCSTMTTLESKHLRKYRYLRTIL